MRLVIATRNRKKIEEIRRILKGIQIELLGLEAFPDCPEVEETGDTFEDNARLKAETVAAYTGMISLADDSGLEVDVLGGRPGVKSARYAGVGASDDDNRVKLLEELSDVPDAERTARFVCVIALARPDGGLTTFQGIVEGHIGREIRGESGFGYEPVFIPEGHERTFAQMGAQEKDSMSHRGRALEKLRKFLSEDGSISP